VERVRIIASRAECCERESFFFLFFVFGVFFVAVFLSSLGRCGAGESGGDRFVGALRRNGESGGCCGCG
jgi:hypothetical protein